MMTRSGSAPRLTPPTSFVHIDAAIRDRLMRALHATCANRFVNVSVSVVHGWVTLSGTVGSAVDKNVAEQLARETVAVRGVTDSIVVRPEVDQESVRTAITSALVRGAVDEAQGVSVNVADDVVSLRGVVQNWRDYEAIESAAVGTPGVRSVRNRLVVNLRKHTPSPRATDPPCRAASK